MRLLVVLPSWVGDAVMATPALRLLRSSLPGSFIGALVRPGIDQVLAGTDFFDELHIERSHGVMGPKHIAAKLRPRRYDAAVLFTNSFSTALICRVAGIPSRLGYDRDGRRLLLTKRLTPPRKQDGSWAPIPAVAYYHHLARVFLDPSLSREPETALPPGIRMELATTSDEERQAASIIAAAGVPSDVRWIILNPGGNNPAKRWPPDRFAALGASLAVRHGVQILISGSPAEADLCAQIAAKIAEISNSAGNPPSAINLAGQSPGLGPLKAIIRSAALMVTNDTGPRHIAAAFGVPVVSLFGPTDHRWTTIPAPAGEAILLADPALPPELTADDHPERCRIDRIPIEAVIAAANQLLAGSPLTPSSSSSTLESPDKP